MRRDKNRAIDKTQDKEMSKLRRNLIRSAALSLLTISVLGAATMAWLANNRDVNALGMQTQIDPTANLIISDNAETIKTLSLSDSAFSVTFPASTPISLAPARHIAGDSYPVNLEYNTNPSAVSLTSGLKKGTTDLAFGAVPVYAGSGKRYYVDYTVYIAADGEDFNASALNASMDIILGGSVALQDYMNALSIDFYLNDEYADTLNYAKKDWDNSGEDVPTINMGSVQIPEKSSGSVKITMRVYFDGGLLKNESTAYVHSSDLVLGNFTTKVMFTAEE